MYNKEIKENALKLHKEGASLREISKSTKISVSTLRKWIKQDRDNVLKEAIKIAKYKQLKKPTIEYTPQAKRLLDKVLETYKLYTYQRDWLTDFSQFRIFFKSRQVGLTWAGALQVLIEAYGGMEQTITSASEKQTVVWRDYINFHSNKLGIKLEGTARPSVDGVHINIMANNHRTNQSFSSAVILDEAGWIPRLELLYSVMLPMVSVKKVKNMRARLSLISTQFDETHFFNKIFQDEIEFPTFSRHFIDIYQAKKNGLDIDIDTIKASMSKQAFELFFECKFGDDEFALFSRKIIKQCIDEEIENRKSVKKAIIEGAFGVHKEKDIYSFIEIERTKDKVILKSIKEFKNTTIKEQKIFLSNFLKNFKNKILFENRENAKFLYKDLQNRYPKQLNKIEFNKKNQEKFIFELKKAFEDKKLIIPNNPELIREIYSLKKESTSMPTYSAPEYPVSFWTLALLFNSNKRGGVAVVC
jgi:phage FluMu gp28-like protein